MPQESKIPTEARSQLELIQQAIEDAKVRLSENGHIFLLWGWLTLAAAASQFLLLMLEFYQYNWMPWLLMPLGGIYTGWYYARQPDVRSSKSVLSPILSGLWIYLAINLMVLPFFFWSKLGGSTIPILIILLGLGITVTGQVLRFRPLLWAGIVTNLLGLGAFFLEPLYQVPVMGLAAVIGDLIPGYLLKNRYQQHHAQTA